MKVCYHIQTHRLPAQILRLVRLIREMDPAGPILVSHDSGGCPLDVAELQRIPGVHVSIDPGGYGDFSHVDRYLRAVDHLLRHDVEFDWLENITGQDYQIRPLEDIHRRLATSGADGLIGYEPVFTTEVLTTARDARDRYLYRYLRAGRPSPASQRWLRPLMAANLVQPLVRLSSTFSAIGVRRRRTPFTDTFVCYGGWFFCTLDRRCVQYVHDFARENPDVIAYLRGTLAPEEIFLQTVLVNAGRFRLDPHSRRHIDMSHSRHGHSATLGAADIGAVTAGDAHWARKFDIDHDPRALDLLDAHLLGRRTATR